MLGLIRGENVGTPSNPRQSVPSRHVHAPLTKKPFRTKGLGQVWVQHLHGDLAMVFEVLRQVDRGHPAAANLAFDPLAVGKSPSQAFLVFHYG